MAILRIPDEDVTAVSPEAVARLLAAAGIVYERWEPSRPLTREASAAEILAAYTTQIDRLKADGGYVTADVIDVSPDTPGLDQMLARFSVEHWHDEDEVRFVIEGRGIFHIRPRAGRVMAIEVAAGDLLRVPRGTWHWFDLCGEKRIRAIRLFQDPAGWTPHYTGTGAETGYQPICLGPPPTPGRP